MVMGLTVRKAEGLGSAKGNSGVHLVSSSGITIEHLSMQQKLKTTVVSVKWISSRDPHPNISSF